MGYRIERRGTNWRLIHRKDHGANGLEQRVISKNSPEFISLGLNETMSIEEAKAILSTQRKLFEVQRINEVKAKFFEKAKKADLIEGAWLPKHLVQEFEVSILPHKPIKPLHWRRAKTIIAKVTLPPSEWCWSSEILSNQILEQGYSWDYANRLWKAIGVYGAYYCYKMKYSWTPLPNLERQLKNKIVSKYYDKKGEKHLTYPFSVDMLEKARKHLSKEEYNWLRVALFFGLRKEEMDDLTNKNIGTSWFVSTTDGRFPFVLNVYQGKLKNRAIERKWLWKAIPAVEPEQIELKEILADADRNIKIPSINRLQKWIHEKITRRSPRRGFSPWLTSRGYSKIIISVWLGHILKETYMQDKHYSDPHVVSYEPPIKKKAV